MKILIGCEESQAVCIEFRKLGFEAYSCDILPCSGGHPEWHFQEDIFDVLRREKPDVLIAFPPCTHLAVSGARHFEQKRKDGRQAQGINFFMALAINSYPRLIAVENPVGIMNTLYRKPDQIIQPYEYGDPVKKTTCLWLQGLPILKPTNNVENEVEYYKYKRDKGGKMSSWSAKQLIIEGKKYGYHTPEFKKHRSKTFPGIAKAMAEQWGEYLLLNEI